MQGWAQTWHLTRGQLALSQTQNCFGVEPERVLRFAATNWLGRQDAESCAGEPVQGSSPRTEVVRGAMWLFTIADIQFVPAASFKDGCRISLAYTGLLAILIGSRASKKGHCLCVSCLILH